MKNEANQFIPTPLRMPQAHLVVIDESQKRQMTIDPQSDYSRGRQFRSQSSRTIRCSLALFTALMRIHPFFTEGGMLAQQHRCYDAPMKKCLLATLLVMVVAAPAFAATKHHHHNHQSHPAHHHHHHKA